LAVGALVPGGPAGDQAGGPGPVGIPRVHGDERYLIGPQSERGGGMPVGRRLRLPCTDLVDAHDPLDLCAQIVDRKQVSGQCGRAVREHGGADAMVAEDLERGEYVRVGVEKRVPTWPTAAGG
jgi:hypothetical protein